MIRMLGPLLLLSVAAHASPGGTVYGISRGETLSPGMVRSVSLPTAELAVSDGLEMELVLSLDGGETFPLRVSSEVPASTPSLTFRVPNFPTTAARLAARVGRRGTAETVRAVSEPFAIEASRHDPLEELQAVRGEPATRDVSNASDGPPVPAGLSDERRDRLEAGRDADVAEDDSSPAALPFDLPSSDVLSARRLAGQKPSRSPRSRAPLKVPKRE